MHDRLGQAEFEANPAHLVLEQRPKRLNELEPQVLGEAADVVVALDVRRAGAAAGLDHVGVERPLHQELDGVAVAARLVDDLPRRGFEHPDELAADDLALRLRVGDAGERVEEALARVDDLEPDAGSRDVVPLDLLGLAGAQQAMVDEDTGELAADRALDERGGDQIGRASCRERV